MTDLTFLATAGMPFPFFRLPFEIRRLIYQDLFILDQKGNTIAPFSVRFCSHECPEITSLVSSSSPTYLSLRTLSCQALSLIRTCQQAHEECTDILYGDNVFRFDDLVAMNVPLSGVKGLYTPHCGISHMYFFLSVIGKANRLKIRHVQLRFYTRVFITFAGERDLRNNDCYDHSKGKASYVSDALDFFSESHRLQSLILEFKGQHCGARGFSIWFSEDSRLLRKLAQFKAIEYMSCHVDDEQFSSFGGLDDDTEALYNDAIDRYKEVKAKLMAAYPLETGQITSSSMSRRFQNDFISQAPGCKADEAEIDLGINQLYHCHIET